MELRELGLLLVKQSHDGLDTERRDTLVMHTTVAERYRDLGRAHDAVQSLESAFTFWEMGPRIPETKATLLAFVKVCCLDGECCAAAGGTVERVERRLAAALAAVSSSAFLTDDEAHADLAARAFRQGVAQYRQQKFGEVIAFLGASVSAAESAPTVHVKGSDAEKDDLTRRGQSYVLLSDAFFRLQQFKSAASAASKSSSIRPSSGASLLEMRCAMASKDFGSVERHLQTLLSKTATLEEFDVAKKSVRLCVDGNCSAIAVRALRQAARDEKLDPSLAALFKALLSEVMLSDHEQADETSVALLRDLTSVFSRGGLRGEALEITQVALWKRVSSSYQAQSHEQCLQWATLLLQLIAAGEPQRLCSLKVLALTLVELNRNTEAVTHLVEAETIDAKDQQTQLILYMLSCMSKDEAAATSRVDKIAAQHQLDSSILGRLAKTAMDEGCDGVCFKCLERLIQVSKSPAEKVNTCIELVKLAWDVCNQGGQSSESEPYTRLLRYLQSLVRLLDSDGSNLGVSEFAKAFAEDNVKSEWLTAIAFNCGKNVIASKDPDFGAGAKFFRMVVIFDKLKSVAPVDQSNADDSRRLQKISLLCAASALMEHTRRHPTTPYADKDKDLKTALRSLEECRVLCSGSDTHSGDSRSQPLLHMIDFNIRAQLGDQASDDSLNAIIETCSVLPSCTPKFLEAMAAVSLNCSPPRPRVALKALDANLAKLLDSTAPLADNIESIAQVSRHLVQTATEINSELALQYLQSTRVQIERLANDVQYPREEIIWLVCKSWNCGCHFATAHYDNQAEQFSALALALARFTTQIWQTQNLQRMQAAYASRGRK